MSTAVVLGKRVAPEPKEGLVQVVRSADTEHPVELVKVAYREQLVRGSNVFWQPVEWMVASWMPGWLIVYLLVYIPAMFLLKWSLRVP